MAPPKVLIAVLSTFERTGWHHPAITSFMYSLRFNFDYATNYVPVINYSPAAAGRNIVAKHFMDTEAEWLMMVDNDMDIPLNVLDTIKDAPADAGVIAPVFYLWDESKPSVQLCWGMATGSKDTRVNGDTEYWLMTPGFHGIIKCGTGVVFIHRKAFEKIPYPWFRYKYDADQKMISTEDIQFCLAANEAGVKIYGNSNIKIGHYHQANLLVLAEMVAKGIDTPESVSVPST